MKPRIALPIPTSGDLDYNARSWPRYALAIQMAGGDPVQIDLTLSAQELSALAATCRGVCLPGSPSDVNPELYAAEIDPASSPADPQREAVDFALLADAYKNRKPVLGICFGVQSLNVYRGGTLVQDLTPLPVNHSAGGSVAIAHSALIAEFSTLGQLLLSTEETRAEAPLADGCLKLPINTSHHQAVSQPGEGLRIVSRSPEDGVVEAVEADPAEDGDRHFVLGVQWHPERSYEISAASRALFAHLVHQATIM